jgi:hypothetical protein
MVYPKPIGYKYSGLTKGSQSYKRFNNAAAQATPYLPGAPSAFSSTFNFTGVPANNSTIVIQDIGATNQPFNRTFTFTYAGSPGAGIIPLVAGGGTIAQATVAAALALNAQLNNWVVTSSPTSLTFRSKQIGISLTITPSSAPNANMSLVNGVAPTFNLVLPARFGKNHAFLSG